MSFHFVLKRSGWGYDDIYEALKNGKKTSEWRDATDFWISRLFKKQDQENIKNMIFYRRSPIPGKTIEIPTHRYKYMKARFVVGYTKSPMLVADVRAIIYHTETNQFEIRIENVKERLS